MHVCVYIRTEHCRATTSGKIVTSIFTIIYINLGSCYAFVNEVTMRDVHKTEKGKIINRRLWKC